MMSLGAKLIVAALLAAVIVFVAAAGGASWLLARLRLGGTWIKLQRSISLAGSFSG